MNKPLRAKTRGTVGETYVFKFSSGLKRKWKKKAWDRSPTGVAQKFASGEAKPVVKKVLKNNGFFIEPIHHAHHVSRREHVGT